MTQTKFPALSSQFGMPLYGVSGLPPFAGNYFWVDGTNGSNGNTGGPQDPFQTLAYALTQAVDGNNDVIFLTGTVALTAALTWSKSRTHLVGLGSASITGIAGTVFTPLMTLSGSDCIIRNVNLTHGFANASAQICLDVTGSRNLVEDCNIVGMANATAGAQAGGRSLRIAGGVLNEFTRCQIGAGTVARSAANASLEFTTAASQNYFTECNFPIQTSSAAALFINVPAAGLADWAILKDCSFINQLKSAVASTQMTVAAAMASGANGLLLWQNNITVGATKLGDTNGLLQSYVNMPAPAAATAGIGVNPS